MTSQFASRHWYRFSVVSALLWPISVLFRLLVGVRRLFYAWGWLPSATVSVPVIVVGNLTVGGTGKTPLTLALAAELARRGWRPGIVSRGYGGTCRLPVRVLPEGDPAVFGDEAVLLARSSDVPVWVGADRAATANALLVAHAGVNLILCDDGLQHYRLRRDVEISVEDARGAGNGCMLPAGPLREPVSRRVDARVVNATGPLPPGVYRMSLAARGFYRLDRPDEWLTVDAFAGKRVHAIAGIGNPERFFQGLRDMGLVPVTHAFEDHHPFVPADITYSNCDAVVMTEKDAIKCARFGRDDCYALRVEAVLDPELPAFLEKRLHGPQAS
jgi:tetraacyldisaccharide 4'-kinase